MLLNLVQPLAVFGVAIVTILVARHFAFRALRRRAGPPPAPKAVFLDTIRVPSILWCLAAALAIALRFARLSDRQIELAGTWIVIFTIVSLTLVAASAAVRMMSAYGARQGMPFAVAGLSRTLTGVAVLSVGALILMRYVGLSITPLLTALGVGGLAVALALQDTLANFFAGIHILVERPISIGDYIQLAGGEEGAVTDIGWRTTRVLTPGNNMVVIPNTRITSTILTNCSLPDRTVGADAAVLVDLAADLEQVRRLALEETTATEGVLQDPPPGILCDPGVTPTHLQLKLVFRVASQRDKARVQSAVRARVFERLRREGVPLAKAPMGFR